MDKTLWKDIMDAEFARMKELTEELRILMKSTSADVQQRALALQAEWSKAASRHSEAFKNYFDLNDE